MTRTGMRKSVLNTVFVLLLFCAFVMMMLMALLSGAGAYRSVQGHMEAQYTERTALSYLEAKLHHYDRVDGVQLEPFYDTMALTLYEDIDGVRYKTVIYQYDGYIRELFFEDGLTFRPEDGQIVIAAKALQCSWKQPNLLQLVCVAEDGAQTELLVYLHSGEEVELYA